MTQPLKVVAISGSTYLPSRTQVLAQALIDELGNHLVIEPRLLHLGDIARSLGGALTRDELSPEVETYLHAVESADLLIVATPVYRAALPGLFKHFFDLVGHDALIDKPVLLAATGGSDRHALIIDHQMRPLFSFFQSLTLPIGVYAAPPDIVEYRLIAEPLQARIRLAAERAAPLFRAHQQPLRRVA